MKTSKDWLMISFALLISAISVISGLGVNLPSFGTIVAVDYAVTSDYVITQNDAIIAWNSNQEQFVLQTYTLPSLNDETLLLAPGNGSTFLFFISHNRTEACYSGEFGYWPQKLVGEWVISESPHSPTTPWTPPSSLFVSKFLDQSLQLKWLNANNTDNQFQPVEMEFL